MDEFADYRLIQLFQEAAQTVAYKSFTSFEDAFAALESELRYLLDREWGERLGLLEN